MDIATDPAITGLAQLEHAHATLKRAWQSDPFPERELRVAQLDKLARILREHEDEWLAAVSADFGHRSPVETRLAELFPSLEGIRHAKKSLKHWMAPQTRGVSLWFKPARAHVRPQPLGVVGIIVPWNYPIYLAIGPMIAALAAGNRVMLKMSEFTPQTGSLMARLCREMLGDDWVQVINGGAEVAAAFSALPFDHLLFTGSTAVGRHVMRAAAANLTPVTLELGGKSPAIVAPGFDARRAAEAIVVGKLLNAGQTCVAPDYVLVKAGERDALVREIRAAASRMYPTLRDNSDYSSVVNARHYQRLNSWLDEARAAGADIDSINPAGEDLSGSHKLPLTLVTGAPDHCTLMQEEIFGPLLPIIAYAKFDEALAYVNARERPLALYLFDEDPMRIARTERTTVAGGMCVNTTVLHVAQDDLPFGGVGASGMGHYHAHEGFLTFSKLKPVLSMPRFNLLSLTHAPYGKRMDWLLKLMLRKP
ncbi:coniferyl aldehyde dehydrogenase [Craterilacuibacter sp.]|uniref:coniferyl aldehyde dehydrogenase n=1 Tax=Craterilacuibacter sp. TaxID=2870909 RepID=UPI003F414E59